ncbi:MAG TPA: hypothetical protein VND88_04070 [Candidatus Acidoferrales bacterium]|nr:hypothetical protein [Candidatus Acidoferrales bacterium]
MSAVINLTAAERQTIEDAARILAEHRDPRTPEQIKAETEAEELRQRIAQSERNFLADPEAQRRAAEDARKAAEDHRREIEKYRGWAATSTAQVSADRLNRNKGDHALWHCHECRNPTYVAELPTQGLTLCQQCYGAHKIRCDQCGNHKDVITSFCPPDGKWRCPKCQETFRVEYAADPDAFRNPRGVFAPTWLSRR